MSNHDRNSKGSVSSFSQNDNNEDIVIKVEPLGTFLYLYIHAVRLPIHRYCVQGC